MNSIFQKNISILKKRYPNIADELEKTNISSNFSIIKTKNDLLTVKIDLNNNSFLLHSQYDPIKEAKNYSKLLENKSKNKIFIIFGFGLGYHIIEIIKSQNLNRKMIIVEQSLEIIKIAFQIIDYSDILKLPNIEFVFGKNLENLKNALSRQFLLYETEGIELFVHPASKKLNPEFYENTNKVLKDTLSVGISNYATVVKHIDEWHSNILKNIPSMLKSGAVSELYDKFEKKPAVIVSAGPSLEKNIELLKKIKGKVPIICVDTSVRPLIKRNIYPDFILSVDCQEENYRHIKGLDLKESCLVCSPIIFPEAPKSFSGKVFFFNFAFPMSLWIEHNFRQMGYLQVGGSVATLAFDLARQMGCDPIIFIGQDLSFPEGVTHVSGTYRDEDWLKKVGRFSSMEQFHLNMAFNVNKTVIWHDDINNEKILTYRVLKDYCRWFENEFKRSISKIINATEGGILKENCEIMKFSEAIKTHCQDQFTIDVDKVIQKAHKPAKNKVIDIFMAKLKNVEKDLKKIYRKSDEAVDILRKMSINLKHEDPENKKYLKFKFKINKIGKEMEEISSKTNFINHSFQSRLWPLLRQLNSEKYFDNMDDEHKLIENLNLRYQTLLSVSSDLKRSLKENILK